MFSSPARPIVGIHRQNGTKRDAFSTPATQSRCPEGTYNDRLFRRPIFRTFSYDRSGMKTDTKVIQNCYRKDGGVCHFPEDSTIQRSLPPLRIPAQLYIFVQSPAILQFRSRCNNDLLLFGIRTYNIIIKSVKCGGSTEPAGFNLCNFFNSFNSGPIQRFNDSTIQRPSPP